MAVISKQFGLQHLELAEDIINETFLLAAETNLLLRERVAQPSQRLFCLDASRWAVISKSMNEAKFNALENYRTNPLFTEADRAALDYATELTNEKKWTQPPLPDSLPVTPNGKSAKLSA